MILLSDLIMDLNMDGCGSKVTQLLEGLNYLESDMKSGLENEVVWMSGMD